MPAPLPIICASFLFSLMGVCVKLASALYNAGEIVFCRGLTGLLAMSGMPRLLGISLRTTAASGPCACGSTRSAACRWPQ